MTTESNQVDLEMEIAQFLGLMSTLKSKNVKRIESVQMPKETKNNSTSQSNLNKKTKGQSKKIFKIEFDGSFDWIELSENAELTFYIYSKSE